MSHKTVKTDANRAVLYSLHQSGPATYLDLERRLSRPKLHYVVNYLQKAAFIVGQPKKRDRLRVYEITTLGLKAMGLIEDEPQPNPKPALVPVYHRPVYVPPAPILMRPGAMDAFMIPSGDRARRAVA